MKAEIASVLVSLVVLSQVFKVTEATTPTTKTTTSLKCLHEGIFDGTKCICSGNVYGSRCEIIRDIVDFGKETEGTIRVELTVLNQEYTNELSNTTSAEYRSFETRFKEKMKSVHSKISKDVKILVVKKRDTGGTTVTHDVLMSILYNNTISVVVQYENKYKEVVNLLTTDICKSGDLCLDTETVSAIMNRPLSEKETCVRNISSMFIQYFDPVIPNDGGLLCMSNCEPASPHHLNCNYGKCEIKETGPQCFCPRTDKYLYAASNCGEPILIVAMYGGVGASIAVLGILGIILGVFLYRKKYYE